MKINIHIIFDIKSMPTGGGNQFLKALKKHFIKIGNYTENPKKADVFLFNSYQYIHKVIKYKIQYPNKLFVHRIDGPIRLYAQMSDKRDFIINKTNKYIADATIFQSEWSKKQNISLGLEKNKFETVITNAPDSNIFNDASKSEFKSSGKVRLIATSWSNFYKKGFNVYKWLDENLDFTKYEMTFCGNSPVKFRNIKHIKPLPSNKLAEQLKSHDIFITASQKDPCSNSLIEALHCSLPAIVLNDGGHPEIIGKAGEIFNTQEEIPDLLKKISNNYSGYVGKINNPTIDIIAEKYLQIFTEILSKGNFKKKKIKSIQMLKIQILLLKLKVKSKIKNTFK